MVKADAYGLGAARVAPALLAAGCRRFVVATLDEAIALRPLLPGAEILVLSGPFPGGEAEFHAYGLLPVLNSPAQVSNWAAFARECGKRLACVLHVDTGMGRLGLRHEEARRLSEDRESLSAMDLRLVMTHLACADEPDHPLNQLQLERFAAARALFSGIEGSLAASSGIFLGPNWHADWTRPGYRPLWRQPDSRPAQPHGAKLFACKAKSSRCVTLTQATPLVMVRPTVAPLRRGWRLSPRAMPTACSARWATGDAAIWETTACRWSVACPWTLPSSISAELPRAPPAPEP